MIRRWWDARPTVVFLLIGTVCWALVATREHIQPVSATVLGIVGLATAMALDAWLDAHFDAMERRRDELEAER